MKVTVEYQSTMDDIARQRPLKVTVEKQFDEKQEKQEVAFPEIEENSKHSDESQYHNLNARRSRVGTEI
jgi:hypothetical protein